MSNNKPLSKEGLEEKISLNIDVGFQMDYNKIGNLVKVFRKHEVIENILKDFDEWAKQQSISFAIWINSERWQMYVDEDRWICPGENNNVISTEKLYEKYLKSKGEIEP